jgi:hypothetical protein
MQKDDKAQAHENDAETELEMSVTAPTNQSITANRSDFAREQAENSFWDCVRPDESPAGDRTKVPESWSPAWKQFGLDALRSVVHWYRETR